jgi:hypothetical protein
MIKAEFYFPEYAIKGYGDNLKNELKKINLSIEKKVHNKIFEIPCIPTKDMLIDITTFQDLFKFSKKEISYLQDCNYHFKIEDIIIHLNHISIWLD